MTRQKGYRDLFIYMNGIRVGTLSRAASGTLTFQYHPEWLNWKNTRPISLSMPLTESAYKGSRVECYFDNLLPDNSLIRKRIQARFNVPSNHCFDLLSQIGADCVGALQLLSQPHVRNIKTIHAHPLSQRDIANLLKNYQTAPLGMNRETDFRISIAGAQEKTALLWHQGKWCLPKGTTPTTHIIKLPIGQIQHSHIDLSENVENEWLCLTILSAFGLPVSKAHIVHFDDIKTLVVERFDRQLAPNGKWLMRIPQEDLCQALGVSPALKYEADGGPGIKNIMDILLGSQAAVGDRIQFMKSVFLFWVLGATDGHAKNFSIYLEPQGRYQLTPLYDVISAYPLFPKLRWKELKMAMALKSKRNHYAWNFLQQRHWLSMAAYCQFSESVMKIIIEDVFDNMEKVIDQVTHLLPKDFPLAISQSIFTGMRSSKNH